MSKWPNSLGITCRAAAVCACLMITGSGGRKNSSWAFGRTGEGVSLAQNAPGTKSQSGSFPSFALHGTAPLRLPLPDDILEQQRRQIAQYFLREIAAAPRYRDKLWQPTFISLRDYHASLEAHRDHLRKMLGLIPEPVGSAEIKVLQGAGSVRIEEVHLTITRGFEAEAILFLPQSNKPKAAVVAIAPATESAAQFAGIAQQMKPAPWLKALLARNVAVAIPITVERIGDHPLCQEAGGKDRRDVLWRAGFIVGRSLVGIEVQQVLAVRRFLASQSGPTAATKPDGNSPLAPIGVKIRKRSDPLGNGGRLSAAR
jgi:hypothetical protein